MGDSARSKRREQLKRWAGSCTDKASAVPRRRWRGDAEDSAPLNPEAKLCEQPTNQPESGEGERISPLLKRRKSVRFDRAAEFLATCASGDTDEARAMLTEARLTNREDGPDIINCSNAHGIIISLLLSFIPGLPRPFFLFWL